MTRPILSDDPKDIASLDASVKAINEGCGELHAFDDGMKCGTCGEVLDPLRYEVESFDRVYCAACGTKEFAPNVTFIFASTKRGITLCEPCADLMERSLYVAVRQMRDCKEGRCPQCHGFDCGYDREQDVCPVSEAAQAAR